MEYAIITGIYLVFLFLLDYKHRKKYIDYTKEVCKRNNRIQTQYNNYEGIIENLGLDIEKQEIKIRYREGRINKLEHRIATELGDKKVLRGRKFKK